MGAEYLKALKTKVLTQEQVRDVLIDLKLRIKGDFYLISEDEEKIILGNRKCPFGDLVRDRPSMCMMTSNVFGTITAENLGYAKVQLQETISQGAEQCKVVVYKRQSDQAEQVEGREYFKS
jgi:predicted ArsR family transcriptional regulator